jgi:hypothetical protein
MKKMASMNPGFMDDLIPVLLEQRKRPSKKQWIWKPEAYLNDISNGVEITAEWPAVNSEAKTCSDVLCLQTKSSKPQNMSASGGRTVEVRRTQRTSSRRVVDRAAEGMPE